MSRGALNLARRPFVNQRPVQRVSILLWVLAGLFLALNVFLYWSFLAGQEAKQGRLNETLAAIEEEEASIREIRGRLAGFDLEQQNELVSFLNLKIGERTFGWSRLFDHLAEVLPWQVRLLSLTPEPLVPERRSGTVRRRDQGPEDGRVLLTLVGQAQTDEALLELVDALFASPAFLHPNLSRESLDAQNLARFNLQVFYLPRSAQGGEEDDEVEEDEVEEAEAPSPAREAAGGAEAGADDEEEPS
jgi:Tfp pilus assembly protein PilN